MAAQKPGHDGSGQGEQNAIAERSVVELLAQIKTGQLAKGAIDAETRRECVLYLLTEGVSITEMAQVLGVTDRTIRRDVQRVREENALTVDPATQSGLVGELVLQARISMERIRRVTREKDAPHAVRVDGERAVFAIQSELVQRLQSLGYLPTATQRVQADLTHHLGDVQDLETLEIEVERLAALNGVSPDAADKLARISHVTDRARLLEPPTAAAPPPATTSEHDPDPTSIPAKEAQ